MCFFFIPFNLRHLLIDLTIDLTLKLEFITDSALTLPNCLFPISTDGVSNDGASIIPLDEFPIIQLACLQIAK